MGQLGGQTSIETEGATVEILFLRKDQPWALTKVYSKQQ